MLSSLCILQCTAQCNLQSAVLLQVSVYSMMLDRPVDCTAHVLRQGLYLAGLFRYGFEFMDLNGRLVITALTDRWAALGWHVGFVMLLCH